MTAVHRYEEQIASQEERLNRAEEMVTMIEIRGDMAANNNTAKAGSPPAGARGRQTQLVALQQQTEMQRQIQQVVEDATKREEELRRELREARQARGHELERAETRMKEDAAAAAVTAEAAHTKIVAVLREAHARELNAVHEKLKEAQEGCV